MRSIWKGAISFGLVNIPVRLYSATQDKELKFSLLHKKDHSEIRYARICKAEEKEVPWAEIVKGYEVGADQYVVMEDSDFEKVYPEKSKTIQILDFCDESEVDSAYFVKPYFLEPDKNADAPYSLLREALQESKKVGIARFVFKNREHIGVLKAYEKALVLNQLRFHEELLDTKDLKLPVKNKTSKELGMALQLIDQLTVPFDPASYKDTYVAEVKALINKKAQGKTIQPKGEGPKATKVQDIMGLLKASLEKKPARKKKAV